MSEDDDTVPATASQVAVALKDGDIDALVELAKTLEEKCRDHEFVESMVVLIYELLPTTARERILADGAKSHASVVDLFTRKPRGETMKVGKKKGSPRADRCANGHLL